MTSRISLLFLVGFSLLSACSKNAANPDLLKIQGDWVVIGDTSGGGDTGHMTLKSDDTFVSDYTQPASSDGKTKILTETYSGTYTVREESLGGATVTKVELTIMMENGKPTKSSDPIQLFYDPAGNMLHDMMTVAYARPGDEQRARDRLNRDK